MNEQFSKPESKVKHIKAIQWEATIESEEELKDFAGDNIMFDDESPDLCKVVTKEGTIKCDVGQWVVKDHSGNFHVANFVE